MKASEITTDEILDEVRMALEELVPPAIEDAMLKYMRSTHSAQPAKTMMSRKEAGTFLGVSVQTIASLLGTGDLQFVRVRRRVLIPYQSVVDFMSRKSPSIEGV